MSMTSLKLFYDLIPAFSPITIEQILVAIGLSNVYIVTLMFRAGKHFRHSKEAYARIETTLIKNSLALEAYWDSSCVWKTAPIFFRNMCSVIAALEPESKSALYIYRGYDQGTAEDNEPLRQTIKDAMLDKKISEFHRVVVITNEASIPITVRWMRSFATKALEGRCHFYVAFRRKFNLGSYVALGDDDCFVAMPRLHYDPEIGGPSTTYSGVFVKDRGIADIIRHYIGRLHDMACEKPPVHVIPCQLTHHGLESTQQRALEETIRNAFRKFDDLGK